MFNVKTIRMKTLFEKLLYAFQVKHSDKTDSFTVKNFLEEGVPRSILYQILRRKVDGIPTERQRGSGRPAKIMTKSCI